MQRTVDENGRTIVTMTLSERGPLTEEERRMIRDAKTKAPVFDQDCPPMPEAMHHQIQMDIRNKREAKWFSNRSILFSIGDMNLILEQILVSRKDNPILFVCKNGEDRYLCVRDNTIEAKYYVEKIHWLWVLALLEGEQTIQDILQKGSAFWVIKPGKEVTEDSIEIISCNEIIDRVSCADECYQIVSNDVEEYKKTLSDKIYKSRAWIAFIERLSKGLSEIDIEKLRSAEVMLSCRDSSICLGAVVSTDSQEQRSSDMKMMTADEMSLLVA